LLDFYNQKIKTIYQQINAVHVGRHKNLHSVIFGKKFLVFVYNANVENKNTLIKGFYNE
jgi:hypothetical protein